MITSLLVGLPSCHPPVIALGLRLLTWWLSVLAVVGGLCGLVFLGYLIVV